VAEAYARHFPEDNMVVQHNLMDDHDSQQFLARFSETEQVTGFAVIGGRFSEGIDLVGNRLIGAIIIGTGLPQINSERDFIKDYYQEGGAGFEMAYQLPGMNRILQTAGRVIRGERDKGLICLVDPRFTEPRYRQLMPEHWPVDVVSTSAALQSAMAKFWSKVERDGSMAVPFSEMQG
jgi:Rad3-related DNA helicase